MKLNLLLLHRTHPISSPNPQSPLLLLTKPTQFSHQAHKALFFFLFSPYPPNFLTSQAPTTQTLSPPPTTQTLLLFPPSTLHGNPTICMIGAGGFIGSNLYEKLISEMPHKVLAVDIYNGKIKHLLEPENAHLWSDCIQFHQLNVMLRSTCPLGCWQKAVLQLQGHAPVVRLHPVPPTQRHAKVSLPPGLLAKGRASVARADGRAWRGPPISL